MAEVTRVALEAMEVDLPWLLMQMLAVAVDANKDPLAHPAHPEMMENLVSTVTTDMMVNMVVTDKFYVARSHWSHALYAHLDQQVHKDKAETKDLADPRERMETMAAMANLACPVCKAQPETKAPLVHLAFLGRKEKMGVSTKSTDQLDPTVFKVHMEAVAPKELPVSMEFPAPLDHKGQVEKLERRAPKEGMDHQDSLASPDLLEKPELAIIARPQEHHQAIKGPQHQRNTAKPFVFTPMLGDIVARAAVFNTFSFKNVLNLCALFYFFWHKTSGKIKNS